MACTTSLRADCEILGEYAGSLKLVIMGEFTPQKMANSTDQPFSTIPLESWFLNIYQHITIEDWGQSSPNQLILGEAESQCHKNFNEHTIFYKKHPVQVLKITLKIKDKGHLHIWIIPSRLHESSILLRNTLTKVVSGLFSHSKRYTVPEIFFPIAFYVYLCDLLFNLTPFYPLKNQHEII